MDQNVKLAADKIHCSYEKAGSNLDILCGVECKLNIEFKQPDKNK